MASRALEIWRVERSADLRSILRAHAQTRAGTRGRYPTQQLNFAFVTAVAAQFQGFCRDLHSEAVAAFTTAIPPSLANILGTTLTRNRSLDRGNATPSNIADDFARIGIDDFWDLVGAEGGRDRTARRRKRLEQLNMWRNAISHSNFEQYLSRLDKLDHQLRPRLLEGRRCLGACDQLATQMVAGVSKFLTRSVGVAPW